jgi:2-hydroxychromene-2-carboxylate isomerase
MIEFFFDCSSPWTYLAFHNIQPIAEEFGVEISWRPILVGGIFNSVNPSVYASREAPVPLKARYQKKDLADWARSAGLAIKNQLKANTDEVMARGGFGSPTIFIDKTDMYFGNDRMPLVREALARLKARAA